MSVESVESYKDKAMYKLILLAMMATLPLGQVAASTAQPDPAFDAKTGLDLERSFEAQRAAILQALADGKTYSEMAPQERATVEASLARISRLLEGVPDVHGLHEADKVEVFNEQEKVNTRLTKARRDSRVICRREKPTGSHRPVNMCATVAERERATDAAQEMMRNVPSRRLFGE